MSTAKAFRCHRRTTCRICGSGHLHEYLDLGDQPPSNSFIDAGEIAGEQTFPLKTVLCTNCGLSQLSDVVSAADIFDDYLYLASTSKALCRHYTEMVGALLARFEPAEGSLVVDIGCNDGILLKGYPKDKYRILGVEPSSAGDYARKEGFEVVPAFFEESLGRRIAESHGGAALVTATNVYAHVDDIASFTRGIAGLLAPEGVYVTEFPYLGDMLESCYFDTIYHEHLSYLALTPLVRLFADCGLKAIRVERTEVGASGPALRLFACRQDSPHQPDETVAGLLASEEAWGVRRPERYAAFAARVAEVRRELLETLAALKRDGRKVGAYTAPAKGNTLLNYLGLSAADIVAVSDNNELKVGKLTPGTHIPIVSDEAFLGLGISHALLLAWNYADFFVGNADFVKQGGKFIVPLPEIAIRP